MTAGWDVDYHRCECGERIVGGKWKLFRGVLGVFTVCSFDGQTDTEGDARFMHVSGWINTLV